MWLLKKVHVTEAQCAQPTAALTIGALQGREKVSEICAKSLKKIKTFRTFKIWNHVSLS